MEAYFASLGWNLRRLFDFTGRANQIQFWPYAITVAVTAYVTATGLTVAPTITRD